MAELKARFPNDPIEYELVPGGMGIFDVQTDKVMVFSKRKEGRFPMLGEVAKRMIGYL